MVAAKELELARDTTKRLEFKLESLSQRYEQELSYLNDSKVYDIFKHSGAADYIESQKKINNNKDETIAALSAETRRLKKDLEELKDQWKRASKLNEYYCDRLHKLEGRAMTNSSPAPSFDEVRVPPPPPVDVPSIDEMMRVASSSNSMSMLDSSIPPPPMEDMNFDEILSLGQ